MEQDVGLRINEKATVPVQSEIVTNSDIWPLFGWMSYERGACMLHMLRSMLGDEAFFSSITSYFTENAYSSVVSRDLWKHLEEPAKKSGVLSKANLTIQSMMEMWVNISGYPEVNVVTDFEKNIVTVYQYRPYWHWGEDELNSWRWTEEAATLWPLWLSFTIWGSDSGKYTPFLSGGKLLFSELEKNVTFCLVYLIQIFLIYSNV